MNYSTGYSYQREAYDMASSSSSAGSILLIDERPLIGDALAFALKNAVRQIPIRLVPEFEAPPLGENHVVLYNFMQRGLSLSDFEATLSDIRTRVGTLPLAILTDDANPQYANIARRYNLQGWIDASLGFQVLTAALHMVVMGAQFLPYDPAPPAPAAKPAPTAHHERPTLTERERDVLKLLQHGKPNKVIAHELSISQSTVKVHLQNLMRKLDAQNRTQIVLNAARHGLV